MLTGRPHRRIWKSAAAKRLLRLAEPAKSVPEAVNCVVSRLLEGIPCPPTDLERLARRVNIQDIRFEDLPISGELRLVGNSFEIVCSSSISAGRRQFTIAHEIGHAIFEMTGPRCPQTGDELERLCDMLATEILMPKKVFMERSGTRVSISDLFQLAKIFKTSLAATAIRSAELRGVSVFEVDEQRIRWGCGVIKKGSLASLDSALQPALREALSGQSGQDELYMAIRSDLRKWKMEYRPTGRDRALVLLQRASA
jgi:hypothetical protein